MGDGNGNGNQLGHYAYMLAPTPGQPPSHGDGGPGVVPQNRLLRPTVYFKRFHFFRSLWPLRVGLMVSRIIPKWSTPNSNGTFVPIQTTKTTVYATGIEQMKK